MGEKELVRGADLYNAIIAKLQTAPDAYNQEVVGEPSADAPCGTAGCIGGWGMVLSGLIEQAALAATGKYTTGVDDAWNMLPELFGISYDVAVKYLFTRYPGDEWPAPFDVEWDAAETNEERAAIAVRLLTKLRDLHSQKERDDFLDPAEIWH